MRIDPTTNELREYDVGHSVTSVDVRDGLIAAGVRHSIEDVTGDLAGRVVSGSGGRGRALFDSGRRRRSRVHVPDVGRAAGDVPLRDLREAPQLPRRRGRARAEARARGRRGLPGGLGRGPHVHVPDPKGLPLLAPVERGGHGRVVPARASSAVELTEALRRRASPSLDDIVGAQAYYAGKAPHISGVSARDDELVIRFREPAPDLPWLAAA